ncbi:MAG: T9SS type A sorting domain-containing protein [bacterium]|nr:T9SS type A sorting domain-containing protein [bacterium]
MNDNIKADAPAPSFDRTDMLTEGFEGSFPPAGWTVVTPNPQYDWARDSGRVHTGDYSAVVKYSPTGVELDEWLITPAIDFSTLTMPLIEWYEDEAYWSADGDHHRILVSTTDASSPANFTVVSDMTPANHTVNGMDGAPALVDLSAYAGEPVVYIAFQYTGDYADNWWIDDVRVFEPFEHDVAVVTVTPDDEQYEAGDSVTPQAVVANVGLTTESFDVRMEIHESGVLFFSEVVTVTDLAPWDDITLTFSSSTLNSGEFYRMTATTLLGTDMYTADDTGAGVCDTYTEVRVPTCFLFTNSGCGPCVSSNQNLDNYMPTVGNALALMRIHAWWPNGNDIMFLAAEAQCRALIAEYGTSGVPDFWIDGIYNGSATNTAWLNASQTRKSPALMSMTYQIATQQLTISYEITEKLDPQGDYQLFVGITEDGIVHNGGNGEPIHNQAFRVLYPGTAAGVPVSTTLGSYSAVVDMTLDNGWIYDNLRATAYIQNRNTRKIAQGCTNFLTQIDDTTPVALSFFDVRQVGSSVNLNWEAYDASTEDFSLIRVHNNVETELSFSRDGVNAYRAVDTGAVLANGGTFEYRLFGEGMILSSRVIDVEAAPAMTAIKGAFPNPFNPKTNISFSLSEAGMVNMSVYDLNGRLVDVLVSDQMSAGNHEITWNATDVASGVYFVRMMANNSVQSTRVVLTK